MHTIALSQGHQSSAVTINVPLLARVLVMLITRAYVILCYPSNHAHLAGPKDLAVTMLLHLFPIFLPHHHSLVATPAKPKKIKV